MRLYLKRGHNLPEMWWLFIAFIAIVLLFIVLFNPLLQNSLYGSFVLKHSPIISDISSILPVKFKLTTLEAMHQAESEMSNVAAVYWYNWVNNFRQWNNSNSQNIKMNVTYCEQVLLTSPFKVKHHNSFWQVFERSDDDEKEAIQMFLYNAYYDNRVLAGKPVVRLITVNKHQLGAQKQKWSCLLWFENQTHPTLEPVTDYFNVWPDLWKGGLSDGIYGTQIIACPIPRPHLGEIPRAVSLQAQSSCDKLEQNPSNVLRVIYNNNPTEESSPKNNSYPSIGVCVKGLRFRTFDYSVRLVEWLEMVRILGGEKVYIYVYGVTESVYKVLRHYQAEGYVEWRHLTLPDTQPNIESLYEHYTKDELNQRFRPAQLLELNDCLYRNVHRHDFVAVFDVDELIVPQQVDNWKDLISSLDKRTQQQHLGPMGFYSTLHAHVYQLYEETEYLQNGTQKARPIPTFLHTMRHTHRSPTFPRTRNIKCLHRTSLVSAVHNHFPLRCLNSSAITAQQYFNCKGVSMSEQDALMMHFRSNVSLECEEGNIQSNTSPEELMTNCTVHDRNMWRYFDRLEGRVRDKLWRIFSDGQ